MNRDPTTAASGRLSRPPAVAFTLLGGSRHGPVRKELPIRAAGVQARSIRGLDADPVVDCVLKALLAAKIFLSRLDGDVAE